MSWIYTWKFWHAWNFSQWPCNIIKGAWWFASFQVAFSHANSLHYRPWVKIWMVLYLINLTAVPRFRADSSFRVQRKCIIWLKKYYSLEWANPHRLDSALAQRWLVGLSISSQWKKLGMGGLPTLKARGEFLRLVSCLLRCVPDGSGINIRSFSTVLCLQFWTRIFHAQVLLQSRYSSIIICTLGLFSWGKHLQSWCHTFILDLFFKAFNLSKMKNTIKIGRKKICMCSYFFK